jgi:hypothetical protein
MFPIHPKHRHKKGRLKVFMAMKIQVMVFWVLTPCSDVVGYQIFRGPYYLQLQGEVKMEAARSSETLVSYPITTQYQNPEEHNLHKNI